MKKTESDKERLKEANRIARKKYREKNKDKIKLKSKEYREKNKDEIKRKWKIYHEKNREKIIEKQRKRRLGNLEKARKSARIWARNNKDKGKEWQKNNPDKVKESARKWERNNPDKRSSHRKVLWAVSSGKLKKEKCKICGKSEVDAHHEDYSKPLEVIWLCRRHHKELHRIKDLESEGQALDWYNELIKNFEIGTYEEQSMEDCKHITKHTEKTPWFPPQVIQYPIGDSFEVPERKATIRTTCADCGSLLKVVEIK